MRWLNFTPGKIQFFMTLILLVLVFILFYPTVARLPLRIHIDYNEGWNAFHAVSIQRGESLYGNPYTPTNYPPISFYVINLISRINDDQLRAGRILSLISMFGTSVLISYTVWYSTKKLNISLFSGLFNLVIFGLLANKYIGMNDPQLFANMLILLSLSFYIRFKNVFPAALFVVLALFTKNSVIAFPLAMTVHLAVTNKKELIKWILCGAIFTVLALLASCLFFGESFLRDLSIGRELIISNTIAISFSSLVPISVLLLAMLLRKRKDFYWWYLICSLFVGLVFSFGSGIDVNVFFDVYIAASLSLGIWLAEFSSKSRMGIMACIVVALVFGTFARIVTHQLNFNPNDTRLSDETNIEFIKSYSGDVLCESIDYCYYAQKNFIYDPFLMGEQIITKQIPEDVLTNLVVQKRFSLIQLNHVDELLNSDEKTTALPQRHGRFTKNFFIFLFRNYNIVRQNNNIVFLAAKE